MLKKVKTILASFGLSLAALFGAPEDAKAYANDYCREYTRTVYIGNRTQEAYGTACLQPNGDWMIVGEGLGNDIPSNVNNVEYVIRDERRYVTPQRVIYYDRAPRYRSAAPLFVWYNNGHYSNGHHYKYNNNWNRGDRRDRWDRHDRHDRHDHRGRGRGRD